MIGIDMKVFAVFDKKAEMFYNPFFMKATGLALRGFSDMINANDNSQYALHPEDFNLFELGVFDEDTGKIEQYSEPRMLGNGLDYKNKE